MLRTRIITAIALLGLFLGALFNLPPVGWLLGTALVSGMAFWEWGALMRRPPWERVIGAAVAFAICLTLGLLFPALFVTEPSEHDAALAQAIGRWFYWPAAVFWSLVVPVWLMV